MAKRKVHKRRGAWEIETGKNPDDTHWAEGWMNTNGGKCGLKLRLGLEYYSEPRGALRALEQQMDVLDALHLHLATLDDGHKAAWAQVGGLNQDGKRRMKAGRKRDA